MKWLKSTTQKSYMLDGKTVPPCVTKDNAWLPLTDKDYGEFIKNRVIASLMEGGAIIVTEKEPLSTTQQISSLTNDKARLIKENTELREQLKAKEDTVSKSEYEALAAKYEALEKEANEELAKRDAKIAELEAGE